MAMVGPDHWFSLSASEDSHVSHCGSDEPDVWVQLDPRWGPLRVSDHRSGVRRRAGEDQPQDCEGARTDTPADVAAGERTRWSN